MTWSSVEVLSRFEGVYLQDGTIISVPDHLREPFQGCGGSGDKGGEAAMRVQVRLNLRTGVMQGPWLQEAVACEQEGAGSLAQTPLPKGALWVVDSLYPTQPVMRQMSEQGRFFLTHARADLRFVDQHGVKHGLKTWLQARARAGRSVPRKAKASSARGWWARNGDGPARMAAIAVR